MKKTHTIRAFLAGVLVTLFVVGIVPSTLAAGGKNVEVFPGVNIYIDDQKLNPTDANGNPVEAFIYNGSTYLPVRAISNALGIPIQWVGSTHSVYVGKHSDSSPAEYLSQKENYFSGTSDNYFYTAATEQDNTGATHAYCITRNFDRTYLLNGQYTRLTGTLYQTYDKRSHSVYKGDGITIYGDGKVLYDFAVSESLNSGGLMPEKIDIDLTGVLQLRIDFHTSYHGDTPLSVGDLGLWT